MRIMRQTVLFSIVIANSTASGYSFGIFDHLDLRTGRNAPVGKPGVGCNCHATPLANTVTRPVVLGLPTAEGYEGGRTYGLTVLVVGTAIPAPAFAGFSLAATHGSFAPAPTVQVRNKTQCEELQELGQCNPDSPFDPCRFCNDETRANATHVADGVLPGAPLLRYVWTVDWTAPVTGTGEVVFYLAGNVVNGALGNDSGDIWSWMDPITVPEKLP
jgi:hypothetical protein